MSWTKRFYEPIVLRDGKQLATLQDAGDHIRNLSQTEQNSREWRAAWHCLSEAADTGGPIIFARLSMSQALNKQRAFDGQASVCPPEQPPFSPPAFFA
jgi:hypothetical protein